MNIDASNVLAEYERLSEEDRRHLEAGLSRIHGRRLSMTIEELVKLGADDLGNISRIIQGIHLTRHHVPDMLETYRSMQGDELIRRVSFGRIDPESQ
jgi:hypothetical protein